jgi:electron transport complex protein RnfG
MKTISRAMLRNGVTLALFAAVTTTAVATLVWFTSDRVAANQRAAQIAALNAVMPHERYDNDLLVDVVQFKDARLGDSQKPRTVYRARLAGQPSGLVMDIIAPEGYGGSIRLLVGVDVQGNITGVRMVPPHPETPGLGDKIDTRKSPWMLSFDGKSLALPAEARWAVKKDGGDFDQFTGATITPRAVVTAVRDSLRWYRDNRDAVFAAPGATGP